MRFFYEDVSKDVSNGLGIRAIQAEIVSENGVSGVIQHSEWVCKCTNGRSVMGYCASCAVWSATNSGMCRDLAVRETGEVSAQCFQTCFHYFSLSILKRAGKMLRFAPLTAPFLALLQWGNDKRNGGLGAPSLHSRVVPSGMPSAPGKCGS